MGDGPPFRYRPDVLVQLTEHGVRPNAHTRPELVHGYVGDLYRHEIRRLRDRLLQREFPKREYASRVTDLRRRYHLISVRAFEWLEA